MIKGLKKLCVLSLENSRKMSISFKYFGIRWQGNAFTVLLFHLPNIRTVEQNWELAPRRQHLFTLPSASFVTNWETVRVLASSRWEVQGHSWDFKNLSRLAGCFRWASGHPQCNLLKATSASHQSSDCHRLRNKSIRWKRKVTCV